MAKKKSKKTRGSKETGTETALGPSLAGAAPRPRGKAVHLRDLLAALNPGERNKPKERHWKRIEEAWNHAAAFLQRRWSPALDPDKLRRYAEEAALEAKRQSFGLGHEPFSGEAAELDGIVMQLHDSGTTAELLAELKARFPQVLERCGLKDAEAGFVREETPAVGLASSRPPKPKRKSGRKRVSRQEEDRRYGILERWARAQEGGVSRRQFCTDEGITVKELEKIKAWARQRENRRG